MQVTIFSLLLGLLLAVIFILLVSRRFIEFVQIRRNLATEWKGPKGHWFWGHLIHVNKKVKLMTYLKNQVADFPFGHRVDIGPFISVLRVQHPKIIQKILTSSEDVCPKADDQYDPMVPWLGYGLLILSGKEWLRHRRLLTSSFHFEILRPYTPIMNNSAKTLVRKWNNMTSEVDTVSLEMFEQSSLLTLDAILKCLMSFESDCQEQGQHSEHNSYVSLVYKLEGLLAQRFDGANPLLLTKVTKTGKEYFQACDIIHKYSNSIIRRRKNEIQNDSYGSHLNNKRKYLDFLDTLLKAKDSFGNKLSDEEIRAEVDTFMFEGHDTTASAITWSLYLMGKNEDHQMKCVEEIQNVIGEKEDLEWEDLSKLPYFTRCVKECLRIYPPVPGIFRRPKQDIEVCGRTIKKGTAVLVTILGMHMNPAIWPEPEKFDPSRFTPENCKSRSPFAYIPFSAGPRNCIGQTFAMNEIKIALVHILRRFHISVDTTKEFTECSKLTYGTTDGLFLLIRRRVEGV